MFVGAVALWWDRRIEAGVDPAKPPLTAFDDYVYYYPTSRYAFSELRAGRFPFWNPYQHAGSPFFATAQHGILYPPNLLYLVLPPATAEKAAALLHLTIAGLGAALLGRAYRLRWPSAATTGVAFAFAPPVTGLVYLPQHLYGVAWLPWQVLLLQRLLTSPTPWSWAALLGACSALQYLGGYPMFCLMSAYVLVGYFGWWHWGAWRSASARRELITTGAAVGAAAVLAVSLSAPQLLPSFELAQRSLRGVTALSLEAAALNSVPPLTSLARAILPMHDVEGVPPSVYVGIPLALLAGLGVASSGRAIGATFFLGLTVISWLLAWGTHTPLFRLYYLLPGGSAFRVPYRFFPVTSLAIAALGGIGVDALWRERVRPAGLRALLAASLGLGAGLVLAGWLLRLPDRFEPVSVWPPSFPVFMMPAEKPAPLLVSVGWRLLASAAWLFCYLRGGASLRRALVTTLPIIIYATMFVATRNTMPLPATHPDLHNMPERAATFLRSVQGVDRTYVAPTSWPVGPPGGRYLPAKSGELHGLYVVGDRENVYARRFADFVALMSPSGMEHERDALMKRLGLPTYIPQGEVVVTAGSPNLRLLDLLGARFIVEGPGTSFRSDSMPQRFEPVFDADGVRISRNVEALPRAFLVHRAEIVADPASVLERLVSPDFDPRTTALLERKSPIDLPEHAVGPAGDASIVRYAPDEVAIDVNTPAAGILLLTDQDYPGWESEVDGVPTEIVVTDYLFRGVPVEAGSHHVVFRFVPRSFRRGLLVAALGSTLSLGAMLALRGQRRGVTG